MDLDQAYRIPFYTDEENLEVVTRCLVREGFGDIFGATKAVPNMQALENVLFDTIYPCPRVGFGGGA